MKLNGIIGKGTGKLGSSVFAISGGEQIVREYNPVVSNPNTDAQVAQRSKLKLMSQIAAALAHGIAFKKQGLVSARNQFVSANIGLCTYESNEAKVEMMKLDLTGGKIALQPVIASTKTAQGVPVQLAGVPDARVRAVVYVEANYETDNQITLVDVKVVTEAGQAGTFPATMHSVGDKAIVYAYGICDSLSRTGVNYDQYLINGEDQIASLAVIKKAITAGAVFTETQSVMVEN